MSVFALLERLAPYVEKEVKLVLNSKEEVDALVKKLKKIQIGLEDAERQGATSANVRDWLKEIEDVAFEMEDVLDEWEIANDRAQQESSPEEDLSRPLKKVRSVLDPLSRPIRHVLDRREIVNKMKALNDRLDALLKEKDLYNFVQSSTNHSEEFQQPETTSDISETKIYGRDSDVDTLVKKLLWEGREERGAEVVSIVGLGGAGKTTLAQILYNHTQVMENFTLRAWASVPRTFDAVDVGRRILDVFGVPSNDIQTLQRVVDEIKKVVLGKKFLIVLDNVWMEDHTKWMSLKNCLHGAPGSKLLVTTRSELVARMMGEMEPHKLGLLSNEDCVNILMNEAALSKEKHEQMRATGVEIAKKCNGLPLAARNVGRMLASKSTKQEWQWILNNPLWSYDDDEPEVRDLYRVLKLSYFDLSPMLKRCFLSCIVFPRNFKIHVDEIIRIWMACGYLNSRDNIDELSVKGLRYFQKLMTRLFFEKSESYMNDEEKISFKVHDVIYDFAIYLSNNSEYNFIMDGRFERGESSSSQRGHNIMSWSSIRKIRTFYVSDVSEEELQLGHLEHVRVLIMNHCELRKLPEEVGKLIHLRHLDLSGHRDIVEVPEFVCDLYNLETLVLIGCEKLSKLPKRMDKLKKLRHIFNDETWSLEEFPQELEKLTELWTLSRFHIGKASDLGILSNLNQLQGTLSIRIALESNNAHNLEEVTGKATLKDKTRLQRLWFSWDELTNDVVDVLQPPPNLQHLTIMSKRSQELSCWIDTKSFNSLKVVTFDGCYCCCSLSPFNKLPALEKLKIQFCGFLSLKTEEFFGIEDGVEDAIIIGHGFPKLKILKFKYCWKWEEWEDIKEGGQYSTPIMPCLQQLSILGCPKLNGLPHRLLGHVAASLQSLEIYKYCNSLTSRYSREEGGSDWDKISHIPHIYIG